MSAPKVFHDTLDIMWEKAKEQNVLAVRSSMVAPSGNEAGLLLAFFEAKTELWALTDPFMEDAKTSEA